jgi:hypothetical protein
MWGLSCLTVWNLRTFLTTQHECRGDHGHNKRPVGLFVAQTWAWLRFATHDYLQQPGVVRNGGDRRSPCDLNAFAKPFCSIDPAGLFDRIWLLPTKSRLVLPATSP